MDFTGAGDAFASVYLYQIANEENPQLAAADIDLVKKMIFWAGAIVCTKIGAISAMPSLETVNQE